MKNLSEKSDFEHLWENAFSEAEMAPSDHIWDKIDASLSKEEAGKYRKRVFMYKLLAAASIAFALGIGALSLNYYSRNETPAGLASKNTSPTELPHDKNANISSDNGSEPNRPIDDNESLTLNSEKSVPNKASTQETNDFVEQRLAPILNAPSEAP
ncbi:MAG: hypothetical protein U5K79_14125 [Cyclobacteriaceae bacterium]|nr:hypothetical protein [Cyclobacteriaceae bacterium]